MAAMDGVQGAAGVLVGGKLWCVGGKRGNQVLATVRVIDVESGSWEDGPPLQRVASGGCLVEANQRLWFVDPGDGEN